jgi:hypothetical protein
MSDPNKTYEPHVVIAWTGEGRIGLEEFPYKEDAFDKYNIAVAMRLRKVILARIVRQHGEG